MASKHLAPMVEQSLHRLRVGHGRCGGARRHVEAAKGLAPLVGDQLNRLRQVERGVAGCGGDREALVAAVDIVVGKAEALAAEDEGDVRHCRQWRAHQCGEMLARRRGGWTEIARRHRSGADMRDALKRIGQRRHHARAVQHVGRAAGHRQRLVVAQDVVVARRYQQQFLEAHDLDRARGGSDVAGVAGVDEDEAGDWRHGR